MRIFLFQTKPFHVRRHTLHPCFLTPTLSYVSLHLQISAFGNPINSRFTFHMPVPSQSTTTDNTFHTFNTQPLSELLTCSSVLHCHSRHPPPHIIFRSPQSLHIIHLHRPSFTSIHEHPLYTRSIYLSLYSQRNSTRCQQHLKLHKLSPSTPYSCSRSLFRSSPFPNNITQITEIFTSSTFSPFPNTNCFNSSTTFITP